MVTDRDIQAARALKAQLPHPARLAVYLKATRERPFQRQTHRIDWSPTDRDILSSFWISLKPAQIVSEFVFLSESAIQGTTVADIRLAAARHQADGVLIVQGVTALDRYHNGYAALYPTVAGAFLAPGTHSDALCVVEGTLWDAATGYLYGTQTTEHTTQREGPIVSLSDQDTLLAAKEETLELFAKEIADFLRTLAERGTPR